MKEEKKKKRKDSKKEKRKKEKKMVHLEPNTSNGTRSEITVPPCSYIVKSVPWPVLPGYVVAVAVFAISKNSYARVFS